MQGFADIKMYFIRAKHYIILSETGSDLEHIYHLVCVCVTVFTQMLGIFLENSFEIFVYIQLRITGCLRYHYTLPKAVNNTAKNN